MRFLYYSLLFMSLFSFFSCRSTATLDSVDATTFSRLLKAHPEYLVVDVRTPEEFAESHIPGSINVNVLGDDFLNVAEHKLARNTTLAVYCRSGKRSKRAANLLRERGYRIVDLNTGFLGWCAAGLPVEKK